jgi:Helix-turn-helix
MAIFPDKFRPNTASALAARHDSASITSVAGWRRAMSVDIREAIQKTSSVPAALAGLAVRAGVPRRAISRLIADQPVNASDHLNVCGALGLDPVSGRASAISNGYQVQFWFFAYGLKGTRIIRKLSVREAAKLAGVSIATISRAEAGRPISAANYFALCSFIGLHPHHYAHRFTGNVQCNSLAAQALPQIHDVARSARALKGEAGNATLGDAA